MMTKTLPNRGVVILFAVLMVSAILAISLTLFNITYKQLVLSQVAQESKYATYAADSARDCAIHWDVFADSTLNPFGYYNQVDDKFEYGRASTIFCNGEDWLVENKNNCTDGYSECVSEFNVSYQIPNEIPGGGLFGGKELCANVVVTKETSSGGVTRIEASGYNMAGDEDQCPEAVTNRTVERIIATEYH